LLLFHFLLVHILSDQTYHVPLDRDVLSTSLFKTEMRCVCKRHSKFKSTNCTRW